MMISTMYINSMLLIIISITLLYQYYINNIIISITYR